MKTFYMLFLADWFSSVCNSECFCTLTLYLLYLFSYIHTVRFQFLLNFNGVLEGCGRVWESVYCVFCDAKQSNFSQLCHASHQIGSLKIVPCDCPNALTSWRPSVLLSPAGSAQPIISLFKGQCVQQLEFDRIH